MEINITYAYYAIRHGYKTVLSNFSHSVITSSRLIKFGRWDDDKDICHNLLRMHVTKLTACNKLTMLFIRDNCLCECN